MKSFIVLVLLSLAFQQIFADEAASDVPSDVLTLTTENFDKTIQENSLILVEVSCICSPNANYSSFMPHGADTANIWLLNMRKLQLYA
jgi:hypothetical protein